MIPVNTPLLAGNEKLYLNDCIDTGWISSEGPYITKFEQAVATMCNRKHGVAVSSGTAALDCAILSLNLPKGSEIIVPSFTIISCVSAIIRGGFTPILVDSEADSWNMDVTQVEAKITANTVAILVVHIYGLPVDMEPIIKLANKYSLTIIEDAAEQHGQYYQNKPLGSFGDVSVFSFYPNKLITTGEGGMVVTDDDTIAERVRSLRNLCFIQEQRFKHFELGFNYRMTNLQAAIGLAQVEQLEKFVLKKREIGRYYHEGLRHLNELQLPLEQKPFAQNIYWVFGVVLKDEVEMDAVQVMKLLAAKGIGTRPFFYPMHLQPVFWEMNLFKTERYPVAERLAQRGFYLPSGLALTRAEQDTVIECLRAILKSN